MMVDAAQRAAQLQHHRLVAAEVEEEVKVEVEVEVEVEVKV